MREGAVISGTLMLFDHDTSEALLASLRKTRTKAPRDVAAIAQEFGIETDAKTLAKMTTPGLLLAGAAFMVTNLWLDAALKAAEGLEDTRSCPLAALSTQASQHFTSEA